MRHFEIGSARAALRDEVSLRFESCQEARVGKPVVTSNQVVLWKFLQMVAISTASLPGKLK